MPDPSAALMQPKELSKDQHSEFRQCLFIFYFNKNPSRINKKNV